MSATRRGPSRGVPLTLTYYLTRSQPPFFTEILIGVYNKTHDDGWLRKAYTAVESLPSWTTEPHLTSATGLSRYYDSGEGPAPEVELSERDNHTTTAQTTA